MDIAAQLVPNLKASLNAPGSTFFDATDEEWTLALSNAFWWGRMKGFFVDYQTDVDGENIEPVDPAGDPFPMELGQIVVAIAALNTLEAKILTMDTKVAYKAGPVESEVGRSAQVLVELLKQKRRELDELKEDLIDSQFAVYAGFVNTILAREGAYMSGCATFVR